jgi:hypothetical protein
LPWVPDFVLLLGNAKSNRGAPVVEDTKNINIILE